METIVHAAQNHVDSIVHLMREKMELTNSQLLGMAEGTSKDDKKLLTTLGFITALPRTVKEKSSSFLKHTAPFSTYPCVILDNDEYLGPCMELDICYNFAFKGFYSILENVLGLHSVKLSATAIHVLSALE
ncbi:hypothetical protein MRX96_019814 [Rhipicephalus microplus]